MTIQGPRGFGHTVAFYPLICQMGVRLKEKRKSGGSETTNVVDSSRVSSTVDAYTSLLRYLRILTCSELVELSPTYFN